MALVAVRFYCWEASIRRSGERKVNAPVGIDVLHADTIHHLSSGNCQRVDSKSGGIRSCRAIGQVLTADGECHHLVSAGGHLQVEARDRVSTRHLLDIPMLAADEIQHGGGGGRGLVADRPAHGSRCGFRREFATVLFYWREAPIR